MIPNSKALCPPPSIMIIIINSYIPHYFILIIMYILVPPALGCPDSAATIIIAGLCAIHTKG